MKGTKSRSRVHRTRKPSKSWRKFWKLGVEEYNTKYFDITKEGELSVREGNYVYNLNEIVRKYGSPVEVVFPFILEERLEDLHDFFRAHMKIQGYRGRFYYHYPMKVNQNKEFIMPLISEGAHMEVGSVNELWLVKKLWEGEKFHSKLRVLCNGPKTDAYLKLIEELRHKNLSIIPIIEDAHELGKLSKYKGDLGIRVNLDTKADTHWDKKIDRFGLSAKEILELPKIKNLKILHYHIGSQITTSGSVLRPLEEAANLYVKLSKIQPSLDTLDMGGGFGVPYEKKPFYNAKRMSERIVKTLKGVCDKAGIRHPNLVVEWGRYIVAPAQVTIYSVIAEKPIAKGNAKSWYVIDGSFMNDLLDTWAIRQKWHVVPVNNASTRALRSVWLAGSSCDSDDKYTAGGSYILLPKIKEGEAQYFAILDSGAYQDALASHHCLLSSPAKLIAQDGTIKVARKRESAEAIGRLFGWTNGDHKNNKK
jgi:arginine decarboxylase